MFVGRLTGQPPVGTTWLTAMQGQGGADVTQPRLRALDVQQCHRPERVGAVLPTSEGGVQVSNQPGQRRCDGVVATCLLIIQHVSDPAALDIGIDRLPTR